MKKIILLLTMMLLPMVGSATVTVDGIRYNLDSTNKTAEVTDRNYIGYIGEIIIPETISYENVEYRVTSIGMCAFQDCYNLSSVTIPNSVKTIGFQAFRGCSSLTSVTMGNGVTRMGGYTFFDCSKLTEITILSSMTSIPGSAFGRCSSLSSVTIPNSVTNIGDLAFQNCHSLVRITLSNSLTSIGIRSFNNCPSLSTIISLNPTPPTIIYAPFDSYTATLKIPTGSKSVYAEADGWKNFTNIEEIDPTGVQGIHMDKRQDAKVYDLNGRRLSVPAKGINIIDGKKMLVK